MSEFTSEPSKSGDDGDNTEPQLPSEAELSEMSREELVKLGMKLDGVELIEYPDPWPVKGTRAERRAEHMVALWFGLSALLAVCFLGVFLWWPWQYQTPDHAFMYDLYTPLIGVTLGGAVLFVGAGVITYTRKFIPKELAVQDRHDGGSSELDKATILAELADSGSRTTIARRSLVKASAGTAMGVIGLGVAVVPLAGLIKNPWSKKVPPEDSLLSTGWRNDDKSMTVFLRKYTGTSDEIELIRPGDMDAGGLQTVFPLHAPNNLKPALRDAVGPEDFRAALMPETRDTQARLQSEALWESNKEQLQRVDTPVMLIRLRPADAQKVIKRKGQEDFNYGDYYAYTKICSHLGCPVSLFEEQTNRLLCPCHQSQFDVLDYCKPIFGPAARALAQLPIEVDAETGYLVSRHDFIEPVGPAFWERRP